jgi:hypothetical protein
MRGILSRMRFVLATLAVVALAGGACGGHPCQRTDDLAEAQTQDPTMTGDENTAPDDAGTAPGSEGAQDAGEAPEDDGAASTTAGDAAEGAGETDAAAQPGGNAAPNGGVPEGPKLPMSMLDVFRGLKVGDWVRTRWTNKEIHTLLVAARTETMITIEEIVEDRGFRKAWTQMDVSLDDGSLLALRVRLPDGTIEEREPAPESQRGTSDLLDQKFRRDGDDEIRINRIEVYKAGVEQPEIRRGLFLCRRYRITVEKGRWARLWFSKVKLPDYPVKINYPEENLTILLEAFGSGRASTFTERQ